MKNIEVPSENSKEEIKKESKEERLSKQLELINKELLAVQGDIDNAETEKAKDNFEIEKKELFKSKNDIEKSLIICRDKNPVADITEEVTDDLSAQQKSEVNQSDKEEKDDSGAKGIILGDLNQDSEVSIDPSDMQPSKYDWKIDKKLGKDSFTKSSEVQKGLKASSIQQKVISHDKQQRTEEHGKAREIKRQEESVEDWKDEFQETSQSDRNKEGQEEFTEVKQEEAPESVSGIKSEEEVEKMNLEQLAAEIQRVNECLKKIQEEKGIDNDDFVEQSVFLALLISVRKEFENQTGTGAEAPQSSMTRGQGETVGSNEGESDSDTVDASVRRLERMDGFIKFAESRLEKVGEESSKIEGTDISTMASKSAVESLARGDVDSAKLSKLYLEDSGNMSDDQLRDLENAKIDEITMLNKNLSNGVLAIQMKLGHAQAEKVESEDSIMRKKSLGFIGKIKNMFSSGNVSETPVNIASENATRAEGSQEGGGNTQTSRTAGEQPAVNTFEGGNSENSESLIELEHAEIIGAMKGKVTILEAYNVLAGFEGFVVFQKPASRAEFQEKVLDNFKNSESVKEYCNENIRILRDESKLKLEERQTLVLFFEKIVEIVEVEENQKGGGLFSKIKRKLSRGETKPEEGDIENETSEKDETKIIITKDLNRKLAEIINVSENEIEDLENRRIEIPERINKQIEEFTRENQEIQAVLFYKKEGKHCIVEGMHLTGYGEDGVTVASIPSIIDDVNNFLEKSEYYPIIFHTHPESPGKGWSEKFSNRDIKGMEDTIKDDPAMIQIMAASKKRTVAGIGDPGLVIVKDEENQEQIEQKIDDAMKEGNNNEKTGEITEEMKEKSEGMNIYALPGHKIVLRQEEENLEIGKVYIVEKTIVDGSHTNILLKGIPNKKFNACIFSDVKKQDSKLDKQHPDWEKYNLAEEGVDGGESSVKETNEKESKEGKEKIIDLFGDLTDNRIIDEVTTEKGSTYTYLEDGRTQRYKKATDETNEPQDTLVYIPNFEWLQANASKEGLEKFVGKNVLKGNKFIFEQKLLNYVHGKGKMSVITSGQGETFETNEQIAEYKNQIYLSLIDNGKPKFAIPVSRKPRMGFNTFDTRIFKKDGVDMRERHIGNKVIDIQTKEDEEETKIESGEERGKITEEMKEKSEDEVSDKKESKEGKIRKSLEPLLSFESEIHSEVLTREGRNYFLDSDRGKKKMAEYATNYEAFKNNIIETLKSGDAKITSSLPSNLKKGDILVMSGSIDNTTKEMYIFDGKNKSPRAKTSQFYFYKLGQGAEFAPLCISEDDLAVKKVEFIDKKSL